MAMHADLCLLLVLVGAAFAQYPPSTEPKADCFWRGHSPFCFGMCIEGYQEIARHSYDPGYGAFPGYTIETGFGRRCLTGTKKLCCQDYGSGGDLSLYLRNKAKAEGSLPGERGGNAAPAGGVLPAPVGRDPPREAPPAPMGPLRPEGASRGGPGGNSPQITLPAVRPAVEAEGEFRRGGANNRESPLGPAPFPSDDRRKPVAGFPFFPNKEEERAGSFPTGGRRL